MTDYQELAKELVEDRWEVDEATSHDLPLLMEALDKYHEKVWHNTAFEILMAELVSQSEHYAHDPLKMLVVAGNIVGVDVRALMMTLMDTAFGVGHILSEGPEHIRQCTCEGLH